MEASAGLTPAMPFTSQYVLEKSNLPERTSAMIWFDERTVVPETTPIVPLPSVRTGWSTPGTSIDCVQFSRSTQYWNSPGLSPRSAPTSKVTTTATLTGMGSALRPAARASSAGKRILEGPFMVPRSVVGGRGLGGRRGGRLRGRPEQRGGLVDAR